MSHRALLIATVLAAMFFVGTGWRISDTFMGWSEETMVFATPGVRSLARDPGPDGEALFEPSCADEDAPRFVAAAGRPRLVMCAGGRRWPVMIAGYLSGVFAWPLGALAPLHHDNLLVLRKCALLFGLLALYLAYRVVGTVRGRRAGLWVVIATATTPIFVIGHSVFVAYEMAPWLFLLLAICVLCGVRIRPGPLEVTPVRDERGRYPLWRAALGGFLIGFALLTCLRHVVLVAPVAAFALWTRRPKALPGPGGVVAMAVGAAIALLPFILLATVVPDTGIPDKSANWSAALMEQFGNVKLVGRAASGLVLLWSNVPRWLGPVFGENPLNLPSMVAAACAALFIGFEGVRVSVLRRGDVVSGAVGLALLVYVLMVAFLYTSYPYNFTPLAPLLGVASGMMLARLDGVLSERVPAVAAALLPALFVAAMASATVQMVDAGRRGEVFCNIASERALAAHVVANFEPEATYFTVDNMTTGVIDSLTGQRVRTVRAQSFLHDCTERDADPACMRDRLAATFRVARGGPIRLIVPTELKLTISPRGRIEAADLEAAARSIGYSLAHEAEFPTPTGAPGLSLYRLDPVDAGP